MKIPSQTRPALWGAAGGALLCAVIGFGWAGWTTESASRRQAAASAHEARVTALASICAQRFRAQADVTDKLAQLSAARYWERADFVEASLPDVFAALPGDSNGEDVDADVARACSQVLLQPGGDKT